MDKVVSNSSPVIALSSIGQLSLLTDLFGKVYIPAAVYNEIVLTPSEQTYGQQELQQAIESEKIHIHTVQNTTLVSKLTGKLHRGELEVIVAAKELDIGFVLIDERAARKLAETFFLSPLGTFGMLLYAKERGKLKLIKPHLEALKDKGFRVDKKIYAAILSRANEK